MNRATGRRSAKRRASGDAPPMLPFEPTDKQIEVATDPRPRRVVRERMRQGSNLIRVLDYLRARGVATNAELTVIGGMRFGARIYELRKQGHEIEVTHQQGGLWLVRYHGRKS